MAAAVPIILIAASTALSMKGQKDDAAMESAQQQQAATAAHAIGTRQAAEQRRQGRIVESDTVAAQVASGGVSTDPGAIRQRADVEDTAEYGALASLFEAYDYSKKQDWLAGQTLKTGKKKAIGTALSGASKAYGSYNA